MHSMIILAHLAVFDHNLCRRSRTVLRVPVYLGDEVMTILHTCIDASLALDFPPTEITEGPHTALTIALHRGLYLAIIMDRYEGPQTTLTIAMHRGLYLAIIMDRYGGPHTTLTIALHRGLYLAIIMDRYEGPQTTLTIALHRGLYLAIIMDLYGVPPTPPLL
jgi:hypothetical protein